MDRFVAIIKTIEKGKSKLCYISDGLLAATRSNADLFESRADATRAAMAWLAYYEPMWSAHPEGKELGNVIVRRA
jgi:hypothetical protein